MIWKKYIKGNSFGVLRFTDSIYKEVETRMNTIFLKTVSRNSWNVIISSNSLGKEVKNVQYQS